MGTCFSVYKDPEAAAGFGLAKKASPPGVGDYGGGGIAAKTKVAEAAPPVWSPRYAGSKDEAFFDSQAWLESDGEDFYSVNGEFTPSRGSTPNYQTGTPGRAFATNKLINGLADSQSQGQPSPRKKLAELFRENPHPPGEEESPKEDGEKDTVKNKGENSTWCCVPSLTYGLHYGERKKW